MALVINLFAHASGQSCTFLLKMVHILLEQMEPGLGEKLPLDNLPKDIRTARKIFDLDPKTTTYATCPSCSNIYPPGEKDGRKTYPATCNFKRFPTSQPCGARLTKLGVKDGVSLRVPIRPYVMQDFTAFVGALYARPGIEEAIRWTRDCMAVDELRGINQGSVIREFLDASGDVFVDANHEIRTVWSISWDGYNPYHNRAAGKSASVGSLAMGCISLPPSICYKPENMYLGGIVPGPKQPSLDGLNPFLAPLVDVLNRSYHRGTWYSKTYEHPEGRRSREAVVVAIADLPGSRKLNGCAGHSANRFCSLCYLSKSDINDLNYSNWKKVTPEEHRAAAEAWRDAPTKSERKKLYKKTGVRWSELLRLSYWNPIHWVIVDGMHNLFLGLVKHHFRVVIGTHWEEPPDDLDVIEEREASEKELRKARAVMASDPSQGSLHKFSIPVLRALCSERGIQDQIKFKGKKSKKLHFIIPLLVSKRSCGDTTLTAKHRHRSLRKAGLILQPLPPQKVVRRMTLNLHRVLALKVVCRISSSISVTKPLAMTLVRCSTQKIYFRYRKTS